MSDTYELSPRPQAPALPGTVVVRSDTDSIIEALASDLLVHALNCVRAFGDFHLALSGGSTPVPLYQRLMIDPIYRSMPWTRTHLWIVDERRVPFDDDRSNYKMIGEIIGEHSGIPPEQVHPIFALADDADVQYQAKLREVLGWRDKGHDRLDFVLLGMGADGHTASLFPHSPALRESLRIAGADGAPPAPSPAAVPLVRINSGPAVTPPDRVTMMLPFINASRFIAVLVSGKGKQGTLQRVVEQSRRAPSNPEVVEDLPILGVQPLAGELRWYLDSDACPPTTGQRPAGARAAT